MAPEIKTEVAVVDNAPLAGASRSDESVTEDVPERSEPEGGEPQPEGDGVGDKAEPAAGEAGKVVAVKSVYTPEDLEQLLQTDGDVDTSRLSSEGKLLMKSFQRGTDKKFQDLAAMRKSLDSQRSASDPREDLFQEYAHDPAGVVRKINEEIERQETVDPTEARYSEARKIIARLHGLKDDFQVRRQGLVEHSQQTSALVASTEAEISKAIPGFQEKASKLTDFAVGLGFSLAEVRSLTDPTVVGPMAIKMTKAINAAYDKINAPKTAEAKVKKEAPAPLQRGASSKALDRKTDDGDPGQKTMGEYLVWRKKHIAD